MIPPKRFDTTGGCSEGLDAFRFFNYKTLLLCGSMALLSYIITTYLIMYYKYIVFVLICLVSLHGD